MVLPNPAPRNDTTNGRASSLCRTVDGDQSGYSTEPAISFDAVVELIGFRDAVTLCNQHRGSVFYVPLDPDENCLLAKSIGIEKAKKMAEAFGGLRWEIPVSEARRAKIIQMHVEGASIARIAAHVYSSRKTVKRVLNGKIPPQAAFLLEKQTLKELRQ